MDFTMILLVIVFGFLAAFIDAVVGGGGLVSIPALLATGMAPATALGTNKLASSFGSLMSTISFVRAKKVDFNVVGKLFPVVIITSAIGAYIATLIPPIYFKPLAIIMLFLVLIYTIFKKDWGSVNTYKKTTFVKQFIFITVIALIGMYDGFLGGGTGSFFLFTLLIMGFDFLRSAGNAKFLNFGSNIGALILFISLGKVDYTLGLIMALSMIVGSYVGSQFAIKKGVGYVKILFIVVTILLLLKNIYDYILVYI
nr:TSUP family transporter [Mammaliicoccus sp. Marseille-Q6498]